MATNIVNLVLRWSLPLGRFGQVMAFVGSRLIGTLEVPRDAKLFRFPPSPVVKPGRGGRRKRRRRNAIEARRDARA
jgi:hypothetical protein